MTTTAVLITGTSSGIGRATALRLAARPDLTVYATARRPETLAPLAGAGARTLALDVTDEESMAAAVKTVEAEHGSVGVLVNNAGYGAYGTVEETDLAEVRRQFETNVFGLARLTQLALPGMRAAGHGRIVNVGSMGGRLVFPVAGYYHASKYAVEALTDALRFEAAPFGIKVSLVEPGLIRTAFGGTAARTLAARPLRRPVHPAERRDGPADGPVLPVADAVRPARGGRRGHRARRHRSPPADPLCHHARRPAAGADPPAVRCRFLRRLPAPAVQGGGLTARSHGSGSGSQ